jgi:hypothetical protein
MAIIYRDANERFFYVVERYTVDQTDWIRYTNTMGQEFTCLVEAFNERFTPQEQE